MAIQIERLCHTYRSGVAPQRPALHDLTMAIETGECIGIIGRSGSGKTTLLQHLNGLLRASSGRVVVDGLPVAAPNLPTVRRQVGMVFQFPEHQFSEETVGRELAAARGDAPSIGGHDPHLRECLTTVGLREDLLDSSPFALSGGEQRRVAIAAALASRPRILVFDEPTAGLDPQGARLIFDLLDNLRRRGLTLIVASHALEQLATVTDRLAVLRDGSLVRVAPPRDILLDDATLTAAGLNAPSVVALMRRLRVDFPELRDDILTVAEARAELNRVLPATARRRIHDTTRHGLNCQ